VPILSGPFAADRPILARLVDRHEPAKALCDSRLRIPDTGARLRRHPACLVVTPGGSQTMFAMAAVLIGVLGIFYVRRRSARKKQNA
jgi:hypothetical protein